MANATDPRAGYALGVLAIRGELADPDSARADEENTERLNAAARFAYLQAGAWGRNGPRSCLATLLAGAEHAPAVWGIEVDETRKANIRRMYFNMQVAVARTAPRALMVLRDTVVDGIMPQLAELPLLRGALAAIVVLR